MSADDFQTKYASVMEGMVKSAIAETTKLFETMVNELRAEIATIKKENEALKSRCSQYEDEKSQLTGYTRGSRHPPRACDGCEKRDTAVQCDLLLLYPLMLEERQPLSDSPLQSQEEQCGPKGTVYHFIQDHDYESHEPSITDTVMLGKPEEKAEPSSVCRHVISDNADSPQLIPVTDEALIDQESPHTGKKDKGTEVAMELPSLEMVDTTHDAQNHSQLELSPVTSPAGTQRAVNTNVEIPFVVVRKLSVDKPHDKEQQLVAEQTYLAERNYACLDKKVEGGNLNSDFSKSQPNSKPICRRSPRLKTRKHLQNLLKLSPQFLPVDVPAQEAVKDPLITKKEGQNTIPPEVPQACVGTLFTVAPSVQQRAEEVPVQASCNESSWAGKAFNGSKHSNPVTLQDARLLVDAMNQSRVESILSSQEKSQSAHSVAISQSVQEVPTQSSTIATPARTPPLCVVISEVAEVPATAQSDITQSTVQKHISSQAAEVPSHIQVVNSPQPDGVALFKTNKSPTSCLAIASQTNVSLQQHSLAEPSKPLVTPGPNKIIVVPRLMHTISPKDMSTCASAVSAAQNRASLPASRTATPSHRTTTANSRISVVQSQETTSLADQLSGTILIIPRQLSASALNKHTPEPNTEQESAGSSPAVMVSPPQLLGCPQQMSVCEDTAGAPDEMAPPSAAVPVDMSAVSLPSGVETKLSESVVRLRRLPCHISMQDSVLVSELNSNGSGSGDGATQEESKPSLSDVPALSGSHCPNSKEISIAVFADASEMTENSSPSSETCTTLVEAPARACVQPFKASDVLTPSLEQLPMPHTPEVSAVDEDNNSPTQAPIRLVPIATKGVCDPHLEMTKTQFLAQLAMSPVTPDPQKASTYGLVGAHASCAETSKNSVQKKSLVDRLRSHLKMSLKAGETKRNIEAPPELEADSVNPKKLKLQLKESVNAGETVALGPVGLAIVENDTSPNSTCPLTRRESGVYQDAVSEQSVSWASLNSPAPNENTIESCPDRPRWYSSDSDGGNPGDIRCAAHLRSGSKKDGRGTLKIKLPPRRPRRCNSGKDGVEMSKKPLTSRRSSSPKDYDGLPVIKFPCVGLRKSPTSKDDADPKNSKCSAIRQRRAGSAIDGTRPVKISSEKTKNATSASPSATCLSKPNCTPQEIQSATPRITGSSRHCATPTSHRSAKDATVLKETKCSSIRTNRSCLNENVTSVDSTIMSTSVSLRRGTLTQGASTTKDVERRSASSSAWWTKLAQECAGTQRSKESTAAKNTRLTQDSISPKQNLGLISAKKLAKAANAKTIAKLKKMNQSKLLNGAATSHLEKADSSCELVKKCRTKAVWTPPKMTSSKTTSLCEKRSLLLPVQQERQHTRSQSRTVVLPPSITLHPVPVLATPTLSPLEPLSVIGKRLLKNQCGECGRVLSSSAALVSHVSLHTGHRPFSCVLCGKSFPDSRGLKRHGRVHRNGRIHTCQQCGKGFVYSFGLTKHIQTVHRRIKPFVCQICNKAFFSKRDVEAHIRSHTGEKPFPCHLCDKKFVRRVELNVHLRWHNGEKRHWCPFCGKGFLDYNNLKRHKYTHTGEKPYSCPHCPKRFTQSAHLKKHVKNVHKIK